MAATEYLAFLPLLIYGIALADLLSQWQRLFNFSKLYLPYILFTILLTETAIYNIFVYGKLINNFADLTYFQYVIFLIPPFLFMLTTNIFTPDKNSDTEKYFLKNMPVFYSLLAIFVACHFLFDFSETIEIKITRIVAICLIIAMGFIKKRWSTYVLFALWLGSLTLKMGILYS